MSDELASKFRALILNSMRGCSPNTIVHGKTVEQWRRELKNEERVDGGVDAVKELEQRSRT